MEIGTVFLIAIVSSIVASAITGYIVFNKITKKYDYELQKIKSEFNRKLEEERSTFNKQLEEERINNKKTTTETIKEFFTKPEAMATIVPLLLKGFKLFKK